MLKGKVDGWKEGVTLNEILRVMAIKDNVKQKLESARQDLADVEEMYNEMSAVRAEIKELLK